MENIIFWAKNDEEAKQIAIKDFAYRAEVILSCYKNILETWISHTPHTLFYDYYKAIFSGNGSKWISENNPTLLDTITKSEYIDKIRANYYYEDLKSLLGGSEAPFIYLEKVEDNKYQYHIGR